MSVRLSVVVATTQPWPGAAGVLDSVYEQALAAAGEVLLGITGEQCAPPPGRYPRLEIVACAGGTVFDARASAIRASCGDVVALTEDHCVAAPDWCQRLVEAHEEFPQADVIGGAVNNGAEKPIEWAAFLISNGPFMSPLETCERPIVSGHANVSFKRRALWGWGAGGLDDGRYREALRARGGHLFTDGRVQILHVQSFRPLPMCRYVFDGGRSLTGSQRAHLSKAGWWRRLVKVLLLPIRVLVNTPRIALRAARRSRAYRKPAVSCAPWLAVLLTFYYAGELAGHVFGPGTSPYRLR